MKTISTFFFLLVSFIGLQAQNFEFQNKSFIEVQGESKKEIEPDEIYINIYLSEDQSKGKETVAVQEKKLMAIVSKLGIDAKNLVLTGGSSQYNNYLVNRDGNSTYKSYSLKTKSALEASKVLYELDLAKVNGASIGSVDHSQRKTFEAETRIAAIKDAKAKAKELTSALGNTLGNPLVIRESNYYNAPVYAKAAYAMDAAVEAAGTPYDQGFEDMSYKKITIQSTVNATFEILP
ncbi:MAG: hypothetical protein C4K58_08075 [Flavobacteriaceae bacterium]|nr:MAG: hypothetical protein C4K58_08075 [Flavobacteriaceae bacterium]